MASFRRTLIALALFLLPSSASAQLTLAYDTLARDTPTALTCGFCETEGFGVVFSTAGATGGLRPGHFPVTLQSVQIALADATEIAGGCTPEMDGGVVNAVVEIWAGTSSSDPSHPTGGELTEPWAADETLVWANDVVPITLSTAVSAGATMFDLQLNSFTIQDELGMPIVVDAPNVYLRVVVHLPGGDTSPTCDPLALEAPAGYPLRDNDGILEEHRSYIFAAGATGGWLWNEEAGINGDWGIRLIVNPMGSGGTDGGPRDAGTAPVDAPATPLDAPATVDAPTTTVPGGGGGCGCGVASTSPRGSALVFLALATWAVRRRRSR